MQNVRTERPGLDLRKALDHAVVTIQGYFYAVDFGPQVRPRHHRVGKDRHCTCLLGAGCPAVEAVITYLRAGGERTSDPTPGFYPVIPPTCPVCGANVRFFAELSSKHRGAGWICVSGGKLHYWEDQNRWLKLALESNPWLFPPVIDKNGSVLYPGLRREELAPVK